MELQEIDIKMLQKKGIMPEKLDEQLKMLNTGFPYLKIDSAATIGRGILSLDETSESKYIDIWDNYLSTGGKVVKMVPASGAASRMFKNLFSFANGNSLIPDNDFITTFCKGIEKFAFYPLLNKKCMEIYGKSIDSLFNANRHRDVVKCLIAPEGLNYGQLPKALLEFHKIQGGTRTAMEEHLAEGAQYAMCNDKQVHIHFTVSNDHIPLMQAKIEETKALIEHQYDAQFDIEMSIQKPSTDTIATDLNGNAYRENGELFFRPGGHGALIENLNDIDGDIIFIKNIDNVVPDLHRDITIKYKQIIGGLLVETKQAISEFITKLKSGKYNRAELDKMLDFMHNTLSIYGEKAENMTDNELADYIYHKLNRPIRVCGMVKNEGEPGGGPFMTYNNDGTISPQILESTQIDTTDQRAVDMLKKSTHFNPVDLVCYIKDMDGNKFDLTKYVDKSTGFISQKSREGIEIKALELPGLWNGAMSDWNTLLIEVPSATFNPVKTVNDLLRQSHQI